MIKIERTLKPPFKVMCKRCASKMHSRRRRGLDERDRAAVEKATVALMGVLPSNADEAMRIIKLHHARVKAAQKKGSAPVPINSETPSTPAPKKRGRPKKTENTKKQVMPNVSVTEEGPEDILRDTKWVYQNIGRLFVKNNMGIERLDEDVLLEAPSNGAIGLAQYCLDDRKAFFEKFVIKIMPKETADDANKKRTEEDLMAEHDPDFSALEEYIAKHAGEN